VAVMWHRCDLCDKITHFSEVRG